MIGSPSVPIKSKVRTTLELESLESLPCGCVAAAYRARPWNGMVVSLEAKGLLCPRTDHQVGAVLGFGDVSDVFEEYDLRTEAGRDEREQEA